MNWYYVNNGQQAGPVSQSEFDGLVANGTINGETHVWREGMANWQRFAELQPSLAVSPTVGVASSGIVCGECGQTFGPDDVIRHGNTWVCAACKPIFVQRLKEAGRISVAMQYAGFWIRVGAYILDQILLQIAGAILGFVLGMALPGNSPAENVGRQLTAMVVGMLISIAYTVFFLGKYGATPGKMVCGLKVVMADGSPISYGRATGRFFATILSGLILGIGYLMVAFDEEKRALHDRICNTRVVRK